MEGSLLDGDRDLVDHKVSASHRMEEEGQNAPPVEGESQGASSQEALLQSQEGKESGASREEGTEEEAYQPRVERAASSSSLRMEGTAAAVVARGAAEKQGIADADAL